MRAPASLFESPRDPSQDRHPLRTRQDRPHAHTRAATTNNTNAAAAAWDPAVWPSVDALEAIQSPRGQPETCRKCDAKFSSRNALFRHVYANNCGHQYRCRICAVDYPSRNALFRHLRAGCMPSRPPSRGPSPSRAHSPRPSPTPSPALSDGWVSPPRPSENSDSTTEYGRDTAASIGYVDMVERAAAPFLRTLVHTAKQARTYAEAGLHAADLAVATRPTAAQPAEPGVVPPHGPKPWVSSKPTIPPPTPLPRWTSAAPTHGSQPRVLPEGLAEDLPMYQWTQHPRRPQAYYEGPRNSRHERNRGNALGYAHANDEEEDNDDDNYSIASYDSDPRASTAHKEAEKYAHKEAQDYARKEAQDYTQEYAHDGADETTCNDAYNYAYDKAYDYAYKKAYDYAYDEAYEHARDEDVEPGDSHAYDSRPESRA